MNVTKLLVICEGRTQLNASRCWPLLLYRHRQSRMRHPIRQLPLHALDAKEKQERMGVLSTNVPV